MPIKHAALKEIRKDRKRRVRNSAVRSSLKTMTRQLHELLTAQKLDDASALLRRVAKAYDHAAAKGLIHRNTAARYKSRLTLRLNRQRAAR